VFAWSQLDFSAIPVSISTVSLTGRQTWQNVNIKRRCKVFKNGTGMEKIKEKREMSLLLSLFFLFLGRSFQQLNLNDIGRNFLLGSRNSQMFNEDFYLPLYLPLWFSIIPCFMETSY
jgi:hypothetical protein